MYDQVSNFVWYLTNQLAIDSVVIGHNFEKINLKNRRNFQVEIYINFEKILHNICLLQRFCFNRFELVVQL
jgi:hypothetical protein